MATTRPIFIHSLFRSASTFFFQKFRSLGPAFTCYQEPFNEALVALNDPARHERLLGTQEGSVLRHPRLDLPYFYEFWSRRRHLAGLYRKAFAYEQYFLGESGRLPAGQVNYLSALIEHADGTAVLQCCRSSGRAAALRREFGGIHVQVWREPRNQWWSYKVADYFDRATQLIYRCESLPPALRRIRAMAHIGAGRPQPLRPRENYRLFYGLWLDAWLRLQPQADLSISLDGIATSRADNDDCSRRLGELTGHALGLSDVRASGMVFTAEEQGLYSEAEAEVHALFVQSGQATWQQVDAAREAARTARRGYECLEHDPIIERNLRQATLVMMEQRAGPARLSGRMRLAQLWMRRLRAYRQRSPALMSAPEAGDRGRLRRAR